MTSVYLINLQLNAILARLRVAAAEISTTTKINATSTTVAVLVRETIMIRNEPETIAVMATEVPAQRKHGKYETR